MCGFEPLMSGDDPKAENFMNQIYVGKEATECDGSVYLYSNFMHILSSKPKKPGAKLDFYQIVTSEFDIEEGINVDYTFQHRYRSKSIFMYFLKEIGCAFLIILFTLSIYTRFLEDFRDNDIYFTSTKHVNGTITTEMFNDEDHYGS